MQRLKYYLYSLLLIVLLLLVLPYLWQLIGILFMSPRITALEQLELYKWAAAGIASSILIGFFINKNLSWLETFSHELSHTLMALLFLRKVNSFHAEEETGMVTTSGYSRRGLIPMALAPYCLPVFTYMLLALRSLMDFHGVWIFDIIVGMSIAFHIRCFRHQTANYQTDINQYPLFFSYIYIYTARLINFCIILVAFFPKYNVFTSVWRLLCAIYGNVASVYNFIV